MAPWSIQLRDLTVPSVLPSSLYVPTTAIAASTSGAPPLPWETRAADVVRRDQITISVKQPDLWEQLLAANRAKDAEKLEAKQKAAKEQQADQASSDQTATRRAAAAVEFTVGIAWGDQTQASRVVTGEVSPLDAERVVKKCVTNGVGMPATLDCVAGLIATTASIGQSLAAKRGTARSWAVRPLGFNADGTANTTSRYFYRRSDDDNVWCGRAATGKRDAQPACTQTYSTRDVQRQDRHDRAVAEALAEAFGHPARFIGYAGAGDGLHTREDDSREDRRDDRRDDGTHVHAPVFRVRHPVHGAMDIGSRARPNGTAVSVRFAEEESEEELQTRAGPVFNEQSTSAAFYAYFDAGAAAVDKCQPVFDAAAGYPSTLAAVQCLLAGTIPDANQVMAIQYFDSGCRETMGFANMAFFDIVGNMRSLEDMVPAGLPLPTCKL